MSERKDVLLRAAYDLLKRATESNYVLEAPSILIRYDDANCDGYCLMDDIATDLCLLDDCAPIPLEYEKE